MQSVQAHDLARLDELLEQLSQETGAQCELLREHLESARAYLVEYAFSLKMARETLTCVSDDSLRARIQDFIRGPA